MADAAEAAVAGSDLRLQHARHASPRRRSAWPIIPAHSRLFPYCPLALIDAVPLTNSISPTGFVSTGPSARYIEPHSTKTLLRDVVTAAGISEQLVE